MALTGAVLHTEDEIAVPDHNFIWPILSALVLAVAAIPKLWFFDHSVFGNDEAILLVYPEQLLQGRISNQDFFTVYGPGNFVVLASVFKLFGPSLVAERLVGLAYQLAIVAGVMRLSRRHGELAGLSAGLLSAVLLSGPSLVALSWMGGLALALWALVILHGAGTRAAAVAGSLLGLVVFWRIEMGVLVIAAIPLLWKDGKRTKLFVSGYCVGAIPTVVHILLTGDKMFRNVLFDRMGVNAQMDWGLVPLYVFVFAAFLVVSVAILLFTAWRSADRTGIALAIFAILILPQAFQRIDHVHVVVMAGSVLLPFALASLLSSVRMPRSPRVLGSMAVLVLSFLMVQGVQTAPAERVEHSGRALYTNGAWQVEEIIEALGRTLPPGSRVFVGSSDMSVPTSNFVALYHLLPEYQSDFYFLELHVGVAERAGSPLAADIRSADGLVLIDHSVRNRFYYPHFPDGADDANEAVRSGFCLAERLQAASVYVAC